MLGLGTSINTSTGKTGSAVSQPAAVMSYYSDFTSDVDGWSSDGSYGATDPTINFNVDNIGGEDDSLSLTVEGTPGGTFYFERNGTADAEGWKIGDSVSVEFDIRFDDVAPVNSKTPVVVWMNNRLMIVPLPNEHWRGMASMCKSCSLGIMLTAHLADPNTIVLALMTMLPVPI